MFNFICGRVLAIHAAPRARAHNVERTFDLLEHRIRRTVVARKFPGSDLYSLRVLALSVHFGLIAPQPLLRMAGKVRGFNLDHRSEFRYVRRSGERRPKPLLLFPFLTREAFGQFLHIEGSQSVLHLVTLSRSRIGGSKCFRAVGV